MMRSWWLLLQLLLCGCSPAGSQTATAPGGAPAPPSPNAPPPPAPLTAATNWAAAGAVTLIGIGQVVNVTLDPGTCAVLRLPVLPLYAGEARGLVLEVMLAAGAPALGPGGYVVVGFPYVHGETDPYPSPLDSSPGMLGADPAAGCWPGLPAVRLGAANGGGGDAHELGADLAAAASGVDAAAGTSDDSTEMLFHRTYPYDAPPSVDGKPSDCGLQYGDYYIYLRAPPSPTATDLLAENPPPPPVELLVRASVAVRHLPLPCVFHRLRG